MNNRRSLISTAAAALLSLSAAGVAQAQQVVLKVHHFLPSTSNVQLNLIQPWCDKIAKESGDKLKCQIYPAMTLGGTPPQLFDQARDGVADIVWTIPTYSAGRFTKSEVFELPFLTRSAKGSSQAYWTYVQKNALDEYRGVKPLWLHTNDGSSFHLSSPKGITKLEDLKGLKIRAATRLNSRMLASLGATPVQMPLPAVPESISKGVIDGAMVPWEGVPTVKLHEIAKSHVDVPAGQLKFANSLFAFVMNQGKYNSLSPELKKVIDDNSGAATSAWAGETGFDRVVAANHKLSSDRGNALQKLDTAEYARWVKASENVDDEWVKEVSAKGANGKALLDEARALINQFDK
ncbi:TRAP transporter substrate-binding protein [Sphaerotilus mobilis]|uniref:TRAP-type C4-dicarboxylate transport system substrate-binding protein n=1 Tax=Sphaerotilus mobilis TaxID=47994 RepID=A0A4Q7LTE6_9BURK|nr:TRAP transporter substrate-binding protein [Sphaerotilus mobilis]RZS58206.1 TRAP-type C4-dicarboxylate transport system substrate-binding protein [Sphaerotilus mobilis]